MPALKVIVVVAVALAGALAAVGCMLAGLFELQGFGRPRDTDPRASYVALLGFGLIVSVLIPLGVWTLLLPDSSPGAKWLGLAAAGVVVVALLGIAVAS